MWLHLALTSALTLLPPFDGKDFQYYGDANKLTQEIQLAAKPHQRGAVWTQQEIPYNDFTLEAVIQSKANLETEVGKSGFALWYTSKPLQVSDLHGGEDSFDGLAVFVDSLGKDGVGAVRGHLNDGTTKITDLADLNKEALSLCQIAYRNAAGPIRVRVGFSASDGFVVDVNGQKCFLSTELVLPKSYFGISANSDISGDIFSVLKMEVHEGMLADMKEHLPKIEGRGTHVEGKGSTQNMEKQPESVEKSFEKSDKNNMVSRESISADLQKLISSLNTRLELMENKLSQSKSVIDQLADTLSISMEQNSRNGKEFDDAGIIREIKSLETQINELKKSNNVIQSGGDNKISITDYLLLALLLPIPTIISLMLFNKRSKRHDKLL